MAMITYKTLSTLLGLLWELYLIEAGDVLFKMANLVILNVNVREGFKDFQKPII